MAALIRHSEFRAEVEKEIIKFELTKEYVFLSLKANNYF